jgi:pimeloyl-ACP methyl ester carboxylesterase
LPPNRPCDIRSRRAFRRERALDLSDLHVVREHRPAALADVIFVHGLGGDWRDTWCADPDDDTTFSPDWLCQDLPSVQVWSLDYDAHPTKWLGSSLPLVDRATNVLTRLEVEDIGRRPLFFVCHSLGGLVVKQVLRSALDLGEPAWCELARSVRGIVFLATPHTGARLADYLVALGKILRLSVSVRELEASAPALRDLNLWYRRNAPPRGIETVASFETRPLAGLLVVDEVSSDPGIGVPKLRVQSDLPYKLIHRLLLRAVPELNRNSCDSSTNATSVPVQPSTYRPSTPLLNPTPRFLYAGSTLNPKKHIYVSRSTDFTLYKELQRGEYANIASPGGMRKSSLLAKTALELPNNDSRTFIVNLPGLGSPNDPDAFFIQFFDYVNHRLRLGIEIDSWWQSHSSLPRSQRIALFFLQFVGAHGPIVVFLDEIERTKSIPFSDDLFVALQTMHDERSSFSTYDNISFCLCGREWPSRYIREPSRPAYQVGKLFELTDFDDKYNDLSELIFAVTYDSGLQDVAIKRVLHWTGGHPYLTVRFLEALQDAPCINDSEIDKIAKNRFQGVQVLEADPYLSDIYSFIKKNANFRGQLREIYVRSLVSGEHAISELLLSGLVKKGGDGTLIIKNRIYREFRDLAEVRVKLSLDGSEAGAAD